MLHSVLFSGTTPVNSPGLKRDCSFGNNQPGGGNTVNLSEVKNNAGQVNSLPSFGNNQPVTTLSTFLQKVEAQKIPEKGEKIPEKGGMPEKEQTKVSQPIIPELPKQEKSVWANVKKEAETPLPVVYVAGKAYVPKSTSNSFRPYTGPTKNPDNSYNPTNQPTSPSFVSKK